MASRRKGRILAFQALYSWDARCGPGTSTSASLDAASLDVASLDVASLDAELLDFSWAAAPGKALDEEMKAFSRLLLTGTIENIIAVDDLIQKHLRNWEVDRLNRVDLAILRMSVYSLMFQTEMPPSIVIDEAIGISKEFGADDSFLFVNGILDNIRKTLAK